MQTLTPAQIQINAQHFADRYRDTTDEKSESQTFWNDFFAIFGLDRKHIAILEKRLQSNKSKKFVDVFVPKKLLCEQKTTGKNLDDAETQAREYLALIQAQEPENLPKYFVVCDFKTFRFFETVGTQSRQFTLAELPQNIDLFYFLLDWETEIHHAQEQVNLRASAQMRELYQGIKGDYEADTVRKFLIRLLFCLFAEDTGIFRAHQFTLLLKNHTKADGSDTGAVLSELFHALNSDKRPKNMPDFLQDFSYINGGLFSENLPTIYFDREMRDKLIHIAQDINWGHISPEIFGSLFQEAMDINERRELGAHYTEADNIAKVVNSLFLNDLKAEFEKIKKGSYKKQKLIEFQQKIAQLKFLDPACGTGNFLVAAYQSLRALEIEIIKEYNKLDKAHLQSGVSIEQFHGIELDALASEIAILSMWLIDHLCNLDEGAKLGKGYGSLNIPLKKSAHIINGNALHENWARVDFILGNPPFIGARKQTAQQKADTELICNEIKSANNLDYVANWHVKATQYLQDNPTTRVAFVSTNSITQGEQVPVLFNYLFAKGVHIHFAYRTFAWTSQAAGKAAVHCVIIGFGLANIEPKYLIDGDKIHKAKNINGYLIDAPNMAMDKSKKQISGQPELIIGSRPTDGGYLLLSKEEKDELIQREPLAQKYIRNLIGAEEFLNGIERYCLWFYGVDLQILDKDLKKMPTVAQRIEQVKAIRLKSSSEQTKKDAEIPHLFQKVRMVESEKYLFLPQVCSGTRNIIPLDFLPRDTITTDPHFQLPNATLYHFAILSSTMHNAFMRTVAGRLKSDYRYSNTIVYNNFPFPNVSGSLQHIEKLAQNILDTRQHYRQNAIEQGLTPPTLAELYNPRSGLDPFPNLRKAHRELDKAVDKLYRNQPFKDESERVAFLFEMVQQMK